jgi:hypothetical protein
MTMIVKYYDAQTKALLAQSVFHQTGADCYAMSAAKIPTCKALIVVVTWTCDGNCANHPPTYQEQYLDQPPLPCGGSHDLAVDIACAIWS